MADKTADAGHLARDPRITAAAAGSMNALKPLMLFQVSMLGMWAHSIERFADNYEKALDETRRGTVRRATRGVDWAHAQHQEPSSGTWKLRPLGGQPFQRG